MEEWDDTTDMNDTCTDCSISFSSDFNASEFHFHLSARELVFEA